MIHDTLDSFVICMVLERQKEGSVTNPSILHFGRVRIVHEQSFDNFGLAFMLQCYAQRQVTIHVSSRGSGWVGVKKGLHNSSRYISSISDIKMDW